MPASVARLLLPAVRWDAEHGFERDWHRIEQEIQRGVGGFILFGGEAEAVRALTRRMRAHASHPLLIASDLERGAGQQFRGATPLPPAAAIGSLSDLEVTRRAAALTAREGRALGVNWIFAPVADVDLEPDNPIIGTRAFGADPEEVAKQVAAWVTGCHDGHALACAKHFPGHGRTVGDSHIERPVVTSDRGALEADLRPFRAAITAGVDSLMTAHVSYPALDPSSAPATLSAPILQQLLRDELAFPGLVITDALVMEGITTDSSQGNAAIAALTAGCDVLLYPDDAEAIISATEAAIDDGRLSAARVEDALNRVAKAAARFDGEAPAVWGREEDRRWALEIAIRTLRRIRGNPRIPADRLTLIEIDDDVGGPFPPYSRVALPAALHGAGIELVDNGAPLVALYADIRAWKGRPGISPQAQRRLREITGANPDTVVLLFSHPRLADEIPFARHLLAAWGGESLMQEAAVAWLRGASTGVASPAWGLVS